MGGYIMNLADILIPDNPYSRPAGAERAERAERAESQQRQGLQSPPHGAGKGGKGAGLDVIRPSPPAGAVSETPAVTTFPPSPPNPPSLMAEIEKPVPVTMDYFRTQGVELLPDDVAFLRWHLPKDTASRNKAIPQYIAIWLEAADSEPLSHKKANRGGVAANTWLRQNFQSRGI